MAVVAFVYADWAARYPALAATVAEPLATMLFAEAGLSCDNTDSSVVCDVSERTILLYMVTAHLAEINKPGASGIVGRVSNASEGSVSVASDYGTQPMSAAYWLQTPYGAAYWQATAKYRTMMYDPGPSPFLGVPGFLGGGPDYGGGFGAPRWPV
jgi:hypothetical protein